MAFQISPGVNVSEVDLTTVVPSTLTTAGAFVGTFQWGPANKNKLIDSEITLRKTFGEPDSNTAVSFFTSAGFLAYGNNLQVVRAVGSGARNAVTLGSGVQIANEDTYEASYLNSSHSNTYGAFSARYPGELGNSIQVEVFDSANTTLFNSWEFKTYFTSAPGTSSQAEAAGGANDEMHIIVIDVTGKITGTPDTVLETYPFVSKASDSTMNGSSTYWKQVIFNNSKYIYAIDAVDYANTHTTWGLDSSTTFNRIVSADGVSNSYLSGGVTQAPTNGNLEAGYDLFANKESIDISLVLTGDASVAVQQYVIDLVKGRADCVAFISPPSANVINQAGNETSNIQTWLASLSRSTSYAMADSGWKYQYDKYNNVYRWIPLNGDIAGLCAYTDTVKDPWFSPAGFNRGAIKNCIKMALARPSGHKYGQSVWMQQQ